MWKLHLTLWSILFLVAHCHATDSPLHHRVKHFQNLGLDADIQQLSGILSEVMWKYYFTADGINWQHNLNDILSSEFTKNLKKIVNLDSTKYEHEKATGRILRRGDNVKINKICKENENGTVVLLFLRVPPEINDYGEILFFNEAKDDVDLTIRAVQNHAISFPCKMYYQWQYPAINTQKGILFLEFLFTDSADLLKYPISNEQSPFPMENGRYQRDNKFQAKITMSFNLTDEKPVFVIDNLFDEETLQTLRNHFLDTSAYIYNEEDDGDYGDNVVTITPQHTYQFVKSRVWSVIEQTVEQVTGKTGWYPYDVSNNLNEAWDHTRIHPDCFDREEYTFLLYLSPGYQAGDLGGTVWYTTEQGEEIVGSVMNKYGRAALFFCDIPHSARPPHAFITQPRLTFAVKMSRPRSEAVIRAMSETLANYNEDMDQSEAEHLFEMELIERLASYNGDVDRLEAEFEFGVEQRVRKFKDTVKQFLQKIGNSGTIEHSEL